MRTHADPFSSRVRIAWPGETDAALVRGLVRVAPSWFGVPGAA
jgi:hypothetical protein